MKIRVRDADATSGPKPKKIRVIEFTTNSEFSDAPSESIGSSKPSSKSNKKTKINIVSADESSLANPKTNGQTAARTIAIRVPDIRLSAISNNEVISFISRKTPDVVKEHTKILGTALGVMLIFTCVLYLLPIDGPPIGTGKTTVIGNKTVKAELKKGTPEFKTVLPTNKTIEQLGGWTRVSPPETEPVFAYVDTVDLIKVAVSQQPLPDDFKEDTPGSMAKLLKGFVSTETFKVGDNTVIVGNSLQGPQSVITSKNDLLILIKATGKLNKDQWAAYISSLQ